MTWRGRNIYLVGLPGAGKSVIARELASQLAPLKYTFIDLDKEVERREGRSIADLFSESELVFREAETRALEAIALCAYREPAIVATGGGVVLSGLNRAIMRGSGLMVWIDINVKEATRNVLADILQGRSRPLLHVTSEVELEVRLRNLLDARRPYYEQATLHFVTRSARGDTRSPQELGEELSKALHEMSLHVALRPRFQTRIAQSKIRNYPIHVGNGIAHPELRDQLISGGYSKVVIVTDANVRDLHALNLVQYLKDKLGKPTELHLLTLEAGESTKSEENLHDLLHAFYELGLTRKSSAVVSLGGGVVSDLTGLAASLYMRGVPWIAVPTTLLAQADAAIGGKTGIDAFGIKNLIGSFYPPEAVVIDPLFLKTLPKRELHGGLAEVYKVALIGRPEFWNSLAKSIRRLTRGVDASLPQVLFDAVCEKLRYVESDEFERLDGNRELLNFGHTFAHALEAATQFERFLHGEAVALGMRTATWLSKELGHLSEEEWAEIESTLGRLPVKGSAQVEDHDLLAAIGRDKKRRANARLVLLRGIGQAYVAEVSEETLRKGVAFMRSLL